MFDWREYYSLARKQISQAENMSNDEAAQKEALLRSAASRAYYAAYHRACGYLRQVKEYPVSSETKAGGYGSHQIIIDTFSYDTAHSGWKEVGEMLQSLKDFRHWADYEEYGTFTFTSTDKIAKRIDLAEEIIRRIDTFKV
jgi:uncharacterized protein (UPF0332 family)